MTEQIDKRIAKLKEEIEQLEAKKKQQEWTPPDKITQKSAAERFAAIREQALAYWNDLGTDAHREDNDCFVFERAMEMCLAEETDQEGIDRFWQAFKARQD